MTSWRFTHIKQKFIYLFNVRFCAWFSSSVRMIDLMYGLRTAGAKRLRTNWLIFNRVSSRALPNTFSPSSSTRPFVVFIYVAYNIVKTQFHFVFTNTSWSGAKQLSCLSNERNICRLFKKTKCWKQSFFFKKKYKWFTWWIIVSNENISDAQQIEKVLIFYLFQKKINYFFPRIFFFVFVF